MIRAIVRVSTAGQATDGFGLDAQVSAILKFWPDGFICFYHDIGVSGTIPIEEREGGKMLLDDVREGDTVLAFSVSRISRMVWISSKFLHDMKQKNVTVICLDAQDASKSAPGGFMFHILASVSQQDRENILKITEAGREEKRKIGGDLGGTVQAWQKREGKGKDAKLVNDPEKIALIIEVRDWLEMGQTYKTITDVTGVSGGTITNWKKQLTNSASEMNKAIEK